MIKLKKILLFARDPGGANVLIPIYKKLKDKYLVTVIGKEFAYKRFLDAEIAAIDAVNTNIGNDIHTVTNFLKNLNPDAVVTGTSLDDFTERYLWKASNILNIPSFAVLDQWMNLGIRFSQYGYDEEALYQKELSHPYLPKHICVMDMLAKELMIREHIEKECIIVTGQPHFDSIVKEYNKIVSRQHTEGMLNIIYVSEPISQDYDSNGKNECYWGYDEKTIFIELWDALCLFTKQNNLMCKLIIRPHPRENSENWQSYLSNLSDKRISLECNTQDSSYALLKDADIVCGMSSMFLLEAAICEKPIISIQIGLKRENPFVLDKIGCLKSVLTSEELMNRFGLVLYKKKENLRFQFIKGASQNVIASIEEEILK